MQYRPLGNTELQVSLIGLGTMTWGEQNTEAEGHAQLDAVLSLGVNLIDTAEMYSVPPRPETYGSTETIIGTWFKQRGNRGNVILATKAAGPAKLLPQASFAADADTFLKTLASRPRLVLETIKRYQAKAEHLTPEMASEYAGTLLALVR